MWQRVSVVSPDLEAGAGVGNPAHVPANLQGPHPSTIPTTITPTTMDCARETLGSA